MGHISDISTSGYHVRFKKDVKLCCLKKLDDSITTFLQPLEENMEFFVFFSLHDSLLFKSHLRAQFQNKGVIISIDDFSIGLKATKTLLTSFVNGTIEYNVLILHGTVQFSSKDIIDKEFSIFEAALDRKLLEKKTDSTGFEDLKDLIELFEIANKVQMIREVLEKFDLKMPQEFLLCYQYASEFTEYHCKQDTKLHEAGEALSKIKQMLYLENCEDCKCLETLATIRDSRELFKFILNGRFYGENDTFRSRFQFITTQLQSMDYNENVLNNLPAAVRLLAPFCLIKTSDHSDSFKRFMEALKENSQFEMEKLKIVNRHMSIVQRWFSTSNVSLLTMDTALSLGGKAPGPHEDVSAPHFIPCMIKDTVTQ
jgi:hypothetical protein